MNNKKQYPNEQENIKKQNRDQNNPNKQINEKN